ncbi:hypothetical protein C2R22_24155 (plasmid) [Salinigranum rubrum]|uniref:Capsule synthesis protein CapA domain-containing protein n=1 Tax=Salinigranum rubrum TaxID=755307 RepID=A0A2I8VRW1_9EURY|nr:hypothetical protein C2R22_24155 [Salinigranum rubrum]
MTFPRESDLDLLAERVVKAKQGADVVVVSLHWGVHFVRARIADYQTTVARRVVNAGADAVIGHHPPILKGVEVYRDTPILYSIGNFAFDFTGGDGDEEYNARRQAVYDSLFRLPKTSFRTIPVTAALRTSS